jgi:hypothetical protein
MDAELRVARHEWVDVVGHRLELDDGRVTFGAQLADDLLELCVDTADQDRVPVFCPAWRKWSASECFAIAKQQLGLAERVFRCEQCGYTAHQDRNSARTILATVDPDRGGADDVRHCLPPLEDASGAVRIRNPPASAMGEG